MAGRRLTTGGQSRRPSTDVARELGYHNLPHCPVCKIGKKAVELYRKEHHEDPKKSLQYVDGGRRMNAYTEEERHILESAVHYVMDSDWLSRTNSFQIY